jgi:pyrroline-5-carboxylate reductase
MQFSAETSVGFIGGGHMTAAIVGGLVSDHARQPQIWVSNRGQEKLTALTTKYKVRAAQSNAELLENCDVVVLSVKPQVLEEVLQPLVEHFQQRQPLIISLAAGIECATIEKWSGGALPIIRVMPNTPSVIREGASGLFANRLANDAHRDFTTHLMQVIGLVVWLEQEAHINLVTAISGSGPAYFMLFIDAIISAAKKHGLDEKIVKQLALKTASGTANMIAQSDLPLTEMIHNMLLPGGTTEQAVATLRQGELAALVEAAVDAAYQRAGQLASELSE